MALVALALVLPDKFIYLIKHRCTRIVLDSKKEARNSMLTGLALHSEGGTRTLAHGLFTFVCRVP
jgi:hypothetical protein